MVGYAALNVGGKLKAQHHCTQRKLDDGDWPGHLVINTVPQNYVSVSTCIIPGPAECYYFDSGVLLDF